MHLIFPGGNEDDKFSIDSENGNIVLAGNLDWETKTEYNLTIQASDGVNYAYTWVCTSCVFVLNVSLPRRSTYAEMKLSEFQESNM